MHYGPESGLYDLDYLQALFNNDQEEISTIEDEAEQYGFNVSASQHSVVVNHTPVCVMCHELINQLIQISHDANDVVTSARDHVNINGHVELSKMISISCKSQFRIYQPVPECRQACPKVLVVCTGAHSHPVPLPVKTPSSVHSKIFELLQNMNHDLPNMTSCCFLQHPTVIQFLAGQFPNIASPSLSDLHVSLANRDHLQSYIQNAKKSAFPFGTGWQGKFS